MDGSGLVGWLALLGQQNFKFRFFWATLGLVGALLLGAILIAMFERWRKRSGTEGVSAGDQLTHFRELYSQGAISKEEFDQIRARLAGELRKELNLESAPPPAGEPAPREMTLPEAPGDNGKAP